MQIVALVPAVAAPTGVIVLAQDPAPPPQGEEFGKASPVALIVILLLALVTIALIVNMTKRIRRLPASFDEEEPAVEPADEKSENGAAGKDAG